MCQEVRGTGILAFKFRGPKARIGPAFGKSHVEAGCEFCGACVSVCPTGTLADKVSKWDGQPDGRRVSTCPFCGVGCQVELHHKGGRLSKVHPHLDPEINDGQLCVRGRFSMPEATHHHERAKKPMLRRGRYFREVTWDEALGEVASKLEGLQASDFLMVVSGDLTNEGLYTAQKLVRSGLRCHSIDSTARRHLRGGLGLWAKLFSLPISMKGVREADSIIVVGLDSRFYFSVVGVEIRRALKAGASLVTIDARDSNLARYADYWLRPAPGQESLLLNALVSNVANKDGSLRVIAQKTGVDVALLEQAARAPSPGKRLAVVIGPTVFEYDTHREALVEAILKLAGRENTTVMPLYHGANTRGAFELGAFGEVLPGVVEAGGEGLSLDDVVNGKARPRVLYLVGEIPFFERPDCDYLIAQGIYHPPFAVDAFLPAASFAEAEGTLINIEGRLQELVQIEDLPDGAVNGYTRPDWFIFSRLADKLKQGGFAYQNAKAVRDEISKNVPGFPAEPNRKPRQLTCNAKLPIDRSNREVHGQGTHLLITEPAGFGHRGVDLCSKVEGLGELALEEGFRVHPRDLERLGVEAGDPLTLSFGKLTVTGSARADEECREGTVYFFRPVALGGLAHRADLEPLYRSRGSPVKIKAEAAAGKGTGTTQRVVSGKAVPM